MNSAFRWPALALLSAFAVGCGNTDPIGDTRPFQTLNVAYGHPGQDPRPCNDNLPFLDGLGTAQEWALAEPLFLKMTAANGNGGREFFLELRAVWTDEGEKFSNGYNRIYFLARYEDPEIDRYPDALAYGTLDPITGTLRPSPIPTLTGPQDCEPEIVNPANWTRVNRDGAEDQVMFLFTEVGDADTPSGLVEMNQSVIGRVGRVIETTADMPMANVDLWIWRAGRTNLQPVPQYTQWDFFDDPTTGVPRAEFPAYLGNAGFAEDGWIGSNRQLAADGGRLPYRINYGDTGPGSNPAPVPNRFHKCPAGPRAEGEEQVENAGLPKNLVLWGPDSQKFSCLQKQACSRASAPDLWSKGASTDPPLPGVDYVQGWEIQVPFDAVNDINNPDRTSSRDVRARGAYGTTQQKGYAVETVEFMRSMNTGRSDDLAFVVDKDPNSPNFGRPSDRYRMVIAVFDGSGTVASGSTEIYLRFQPPTPYPGPVNRCQ